MAYGIRAWASDGKLQLDTTSRLFRFHSHYVLSVNSGATVNQSVSGMLNDGTWFCWPSNNLVYTNINSGSFALKNNLVFNTPNVEIYVFRL